jgi:holo-[acyl-carrier protein] synthase
MTDGTVLGIGVDLVETARMQESVERWGDRFIARIFGAAERSYCDDKPEPWRHYAGRFAVKEAVSKAFGTGIGAQIGWLDIEVARAASSGAPSVRLHGRGAELARVRGVARVLVSLSHTRRYAVAQAVLLGTPPGEWQNEEGAG